jgi:FtsP/CotA-like multicopper oxidase with cupredoxin domain
MNSFAQIDTTVSLVSKIDAFPQFELYDGNQIYMMGYTTTIGGAIKAPSPTLNFKEGDSVRIDMWNLSQGPPHTIHLHGLDVNQENDGVPALSFAVEHDDTGSYFFKVPHPGTYIYHCHETSVLHVQAGMYGLVIVRPQSADTLTWENGYSFHREYAWMTSEIDTNWHVDSIINHPHDTTATTHLILDYNPQHFLVNGMSEHQLDNSSAEIVGGEGETIYLRLANIGNYGNTYLFPAGLNAVVIASDGRPLPASFSADTLEVLPGERYGVLFEANSQFLDSIQVDYFSLNTQEVENTQYVNVDINGYVGVSEINIESRVLMYPNPASSVLNIEFENDEQESGFVRMTNMLGQNVLEQKFSGSKVALNINTLKSGMYTVQVICENRQWRQQLIIN